MFESWKKNQKKEEEKFPASPPQAFVLPIELIREERRGKKGQIKDVLSEFISACTQHESLFLKVMS